MNKINFGKFLRDNYPKLFLKIRKMRGHGIEPEFVLLPYLCDKNKTSIDIGANLGDYTSRIIKYSKQCWAFEPIPILSEFLNRAFSKKVFVESIALSNTNGKVTIRIPDGAFALASIEKSNKFTNPSHIDELTVPMKKLDDYDFDNVGFIKIDVEGHEQEVIKGAINLLQKFKPALLIEAEERHRKNTIENISKYLKELGYQGYFLYNDKLHHIEEFDIRIHQNQTNIENIKKENLVGKYVSNFIFLLPEKLPDLKKFLQN